MAQGPAGSGSSVSGQGGHRDVKPQPRTTREEQRQAYQRFRPPFNRAGFEIVDCPPMTSEGKTSTDIHMALDVVDLIQHQVHYDEFIDFSADTDFTPVLRSFRR